MGVPPTRILETTRLAVRGSGKATCFDSSRKKRRIQMSSTTVKDVMTPGPTAVASDAMVIEAARRMLSEDVGSLPVVEGNALVGMVTDRDLVLNVVAKDLDPNKVSVSDVCSENPVTAQPDEPLDDALQRMASEQLRRLPVVTDGRLVGILAQADIARAVRPESTGRMVEEISA
jgi:CBS domain-containing protein